MEGSIECVFFLHIVSLPCFEADGWMGLTWIVLVIIVRFHSGLYAILQYNRYYNILLYVIATTSNC